MPSLSRAFLRHLAVPADLVQTIRQMGSFSVSELQAMCPSVSRDWIKIVLGQLKKEGRLTLSGRGRNARWHEAGMGD